MAKDEAASPPFEEHPTVQLLRRSPARDAAAPLSLERLRALALEAGADDVRSPRRSVANLEFHRTGREVDEVAQRLAVALSALGHRTINPAMAFPMELAESKDRHELDDNRGESR